jgi:nucleoside-diphosphate-sugar epimerase
MTGLCVVTGGSGFIGRALVSLLARRGSRVRVFDARKDENPVGGVDYFIGDLRDPAATDRACDGAETLFHLAAVRGGADAETIREVNVNGTANLLESACLTGVKTLVFASSTAVYGLPPAELPCSENAPLTSTGPYSLSKIVGEELCLSIRERTGMKVAVIRPAIAIGPGYDNALVLQWIIDRAIAHQPVFTLAGGRTRRHYIDIGDCAESFVAAAESEVSDGQCFNVGFDRSHTDEEFTKAAIRAAHSLSLVVPLPRPVVEIGVNIARAIGQEPAVPEFRDSLLHDAYFDIDKAKALLEWRPRKNLPVTLHEFMKWYKRKLLRRNTV